jgi:hypothetical protein
MPIPYDGDANEGTSNQAAGIPLEDFNLEQKRDIETFEPGDLVLIQAHLNRFKWIGPLVITGSPYPGVYMLKWKDSGKRWKSPMSQVQLRRCMENKGEPNSDATDTTADAERSCYQLGIAPISEGALGKQVFHMSLLTPSPPLTTLQDHEVK